MKGVDARLLRHRIGIITPPSEEWRARAYARLNTLTKPSGSLGRLEDLAAQIVAIRQEVFTDHVNKSVYVFASDHGVTVEGVSAYPRDVTQQMVLNFLGGGAAVSVLANQCDAALHVIDIGVDADLSCLAGVLHRKVARGTRNMLREPAMDDNELLRAVEIGVEMAAHAVSNGYSIVAIGEMGIGNTTAASVITCALTGAIASAATGRGTGVDQDQFAHKVKVVQQTIALHFGKQELDAMNILRCAGGFEIAAMTGMMLASARERLVVVVDGFISTAAAALAVAIDPAVKGYLVAGHCSEEPGHQLLLDYLGLQPILKLNMRLGEGTGAVVAMPLLEAAITLYVQMATFAEAGVSGVTR